MAVTVKDVVKLYVAMFQRAPEGEAVDYWYSWAYPDKTLEELANEMAKAAVKLVNEKPTEYGDDYPQYLGIDLNNLTLEQAKAIVNSMYQILFNKNQDTDPQGVEFWAQSMLTNGIGKVVIGMLESAEDIYNNPNADPAAKAAATAFMNKVTAAEEISKVVRKFDGDFQKFKGWIANVTDDPNTVQQAVDSAKSVGAKVFNLTAGIDNLVGTDGPDIFNAVQTANSTVLNSLDVIDGKGDNDVLNIDDQATANNSDFKLPAGITIKNIETLNLTTTGDLGDDGTVGYQFDISSYSDIKTANLIAGGSGASEAKVADATDVTLTVAGSTNNIDISGGKNVTTNNGAQVSITGKALENVTVNKASGAITIDNLDAIGTSGAGTTLTSVTLNSLNSNATLKGKSISNLTINGPTATGLTITVTNSTPDHDLTVNVNGAGYDSAGNANTTAPNIADVNAATMTVNATGSKSNIDISGSTAVSTLTIKGDGALTIKVDDATGNVKTVDGSAATGDLTLTNLASTTTIIKTGSGNDTFTTKATETMTVLSGAGNDVVTLGDNVAAGSNIDLGEGDDILIGEIVINTSTSSPTVIDGGTGEDTVSAGLITVGSAPLFKNFEGLDVSALSSAKTVDADLLTGSTITKVTIAGSSQTGSVTVDNLNPQSKLYVYGSNGAPTTLNIKNASTNTSDTFDIIFSAQDKSTPTTINANTIVINEIENVNIDSSGGENVSNQITLTDNKLQKLVITGDKDLSLSFTGTNGTNVNNTGAVSLIDGSVATGKLTINTTNVTADGTLGLTVKGGTNDDSITLAQKATVDAGNGNDTITVSNDGGTITGGAGNDIFDVSADTLSAANSTGIDTTITDFSQGDKIKLNTNNTSTSLGSAVDVSNASTLDDALTIAIQAIAYQNTGWFQYAGNTYIVVDLNDDTTNEGTTTEAITTNDQVIKLVGTIDLTGATIDSNDYLQLPV